MSRRNGFTLLEILVAISILGISLVVLMQAFSRGLRAADRAATVSTEAFLLRTVMEEAYLAREPLEGTESGSFESMPEYEWERTIELYEELPPVLEEADAGKGEAVREVLEEDLFRVFRITARVHRTGRRGGVRATSLRLFGPEEEMQE